MTDKITLVEVDDYRTGVYLNGICISNAEWSTGAQTVRVICEALGVEYEDIFIEMGEQELLNVYLPNGRDYPVELPE